MIIKSQVVSAGIEKNLFKIVDACDSIYQATDKSCTW